MCKITFSDKEIKILQKNPNVQRVSLLAITYTDDFKNRFMDKYLVGKLPRQIFEENGFDVNILGIKRIEQSAYRWKKAYEKDGLIGLSDESMSRRGNCWDNAPQESFFGHLKDEVDYQSCKTLKELKAIINHYMVYYNNYRYQWNLKKMTPIQYRNHLLAA